jgi:hypothetical protein
VLSAETFDGEPPATELPSKPPPPTVDDATDGKDPAPDPTVHHVAFVEEPEIATIDMEAVATSAYVVEEDDEDDELHEVLSVGASSIGSAAPARDYIVVEDDAETGDWSPEVRIDRSSCVLHLTSRDRTVRRMQCHLLLKTSRPRALPILSLRP